MPLLTIIMPVFNGEGTIARAIDSIIAQDCSYPYEILVVDDASDDGTVGIVEGYFGKCDIRLVKNPRNMGNAEAFHKGLKNCTSKYWSVLDADDYYTYRKKLQIELDFLESDREEKYVGVAHRCIIDYGEGKVDLQGRTRVREFDYDDFLVGQIDYCHTSTYIYRNLYHGNPPEYLSENRFRGDTVRTALSLRDSKKKIRIIDIVGSVYSKNGEGIWSSLSNKKKLDRQLTLLNALKDTSETERERASYRYLINRDRILFRVDRGHTPGSIQSLVSKVNADVLSFDNDVESDGFSCSAYYDSLIESLKVLIATNSGNDILRSDMICVFLTDASADSISKANDIISSLEKDVYLFLPKDMSLADSDSIKKRMILDIDTIDECFADYRKHVPVSSIIIGNGSNYLPFLIIDDLANCTFFVTKEKGFIAGLSDRNIGFMKINDDGTYSKLELDTVYNVDDNPSTEDKSVFIRIKRMINGVVRKVIR